MKEEHDQSPILVDILGKLKHIYSVDEDFCHQLHFAL